MIKDSPLPPCISLDDTRKENLTHTRNATGITIWVCTELPDENNWDSGTWTNIASRTIRIPEHIGSKDTDNCISELMAACMAEEFLPPGQNEI